MFRVFRRTYAPYSSEKYRNGKKLKKNNIEKENLSNENNDGNSTVKLLSEFYIIKIYLTEIIF